MPGSRTSRTTQAGASGRSNSRNSVADPKVSTRKPTESSRLRIAVRAAESSSTTNTMGASSDISAASIDGKREAENRATVRTVSPQLAAMRLDNRAADRQPHAQSVRLGSEEGIENTVRPF